MEQKKPKYLFIADFLKNKIEEGIYKEDSLLPTEEQIVSTFAVSRVTARNAIAHLENNGYVTRRQGKGTIVCKQRTSQTLNSLSSFTETLQAEGYAVETMYLDIALLKPPQHVMKKLNIQECDKVYLVQRTKGIEGVPIAFFRNYLVSSKVPGLEEKVAELRTHGLYQFIEKEYDFKLHSAVDMIGAYKCGPLESDFLGIPIGDPLLCDNRLTYFADGTPFECCTAVFRADKYEFRVYLENR